MGFIVSDANLMKYRLSLSLPLIALLLCVFLYSISSHASVHKDNNPGLWQQWTFAGQAKDETNHVYFYHFNYQQASNHQEVDVLVFDELYRVITHYHKKGSTRANKPAMDFSWHLGLAFFRFSPITKSWVFGLTNVKDVGFNFKADLSEPDGDLGERQHMADSLITEVSQLHQLNGHLDNTKLKQETFLTAKQGWLRYVESSRPLEKFSSLLCLKGDGAGLYSFQYHATNAQKAAIAGFRNKRGQRESISQFIQADVWQDGKRYLHVTNPKLDWTLTHIDLNSTDTADSIEACTVLNEPDHIMCFIQQIHT